MGLLSDSLHSIIRDANQTLRGWYGYFQISRAGSHLFRRLDSWLRMRLRSILRPRAHRRGKDHQRWPNKFFETLGLFSLHAARVVRYILSEVKEDATTEPP